MPTTEEMNDPYSAFNIEKRNRIFVQDMLNFSNEMGFIKEGGPIELVELGKNGKNSVVCFRQAKEEEK